jgi:hypothetical protein
VVHGLVDEVRAEDKRDDGDRHICTRLNGRAQKCK